MSNSVFTVTIPFDGLNNDQLPGYHLPASPDYGGITVLAASAYIVGTANVTLITMTNVGTPVANGTIAAAVGGTASAGVPYSFTISDGFVDSGEWIGVQENNIGTPTAGFVTLTCTMGK
jgi:hypothetical protein